MSVRLLYMEYKERRRTASKYTWFCEHYRLRARKLNPVIRQEHRAGEKLLSTSAASPSIVDPAAGVISRAQLLVAVLGAGH